MMSSRGWAVPVRFTAVRKRGTQVFCTGSVPLTGTPVPMPGALADSFA